MTEPSIRPPAPHGASPDGPVGGAEGPFDFGARGPQWQAGLDIVRRYPWPCVAVAAALGFWLGRNRGRAIATAAAGLATKAVMNELGRAFDAAEF